MNRTMVDSIPSNEDIQWLLKNGSLNDLHKLSMDLSRLLAMVNREIGRRGRGHHNRQETDREDNGAD